MPTLEKTWNWIVDRDAKVVFVLSILAFLGMTAWRGWIELSAFRNRERDPEPHSARKKDVPQTPSFEPIGLLNYVTNQAAGTSRVPVNPFRPTAEEIVARIVEADEPAEPADPSDPSDPSAESDPSSPSEPPAGTDPSANTDPSAAADPSRPKENGSQGPRERVPAPERITYRGVFRRTDGVAAAWVEDAATGVSLFYPVDEKIHGVTVLDADMRSLTLRLPDDTEKTIELGETLNIPPPPPPEKKEEE